MKRFRDVSVALCGTGAIGSNLAMNLGRQGFSSLLLIDRDRVEPQNLGTQIWSEAEVGLFKAECLMNRLFDELGLEVEARPKELTSKNVSKLLQASTLIVDSFDNSDARKIAQEYSMNSGIPCLHVGLNADYAEVIWNESYRVPSAGGEDVCDYPLARNLILLAVAVTSETLVRYVMTGEAKNFTITLGDFAIREF
jgi:molybdopterin/thiamine biosynthesis adenylyltransferase